jgi:hypothetical protein
MKRFFSILVTLAILLFGTLPQMASACPSCQDAPRASGGADDDGNNNPAAYNNSIYIMVGVPYTCLAVLGLLVYRGTKKNDEFRRAHGWEASSGPASLQAPMPS